TQIEAIENIDIGGPTLIRAAAKKHAWCTVLTSPTDYAAFLGEFKKNNGMIFAQSRFHFAISAFSRIAEYDNVISQYFISQQNKASLFPDTLVLQYPLKTLLRYGENPHQQAAFYHTPEARPDSITGALLLYPSAKGIQGKALSYNNIVDA